MKKVFLAFILLVIVFFSFCSISGLDISFFDTGEKLEDGQLRTPVLTGAKTVDDGVQISWKRSPGAEKYRVFRRMAGEKKWERLGDTKDLTFLDEMADPGVVYTYTVRCVSEDGKTYTSAYDKEGLTTTVS